MTKRGERGTALVEAMVGAAIVALTLATMYEAILHVAARNRMAEDRRMALMIAESQLAAVGPVIPIAPGVSEGTDGDFFWRVDIEPYNGGPPPNAVGLLCSVKVVVEDHHRQPLATINTLRLTKGV
jgi:general secretion pathway protein I